MMLNNNIKSKLDDLKKENPFKVPEKYFDDFPVKMAHLISDTDKKIQYVPFWETLKPKLKPILIISGITIIALLSILVVRINPSHEITANELAEIYRYSAINETSEADLIKELERVSNTENTTNDSIPGSSDNFKNEAIDFLKNENIDLNTMIDAL